MTCPTSDIQVTTNYSHHPLSVGQPRPWWWHELRDLKHCLLPPSPSPSPPRCELCAEHSAGHSECQEKEAKMKWSTVSIPRCWCPFQLGWKLTCGRNLNRVTEQGTFGWKPLFSRGFKQEILMWLQSPEKGGDCPVKGRAEGRPQLYSYKLSALPTALPQLIKFTAREEPEGKFIWG